jgi:hypothetical protein
MKSMGLEFAQSDLRSLISDTNTIKSNIYTLDRELESIRINTNLNAMDLKSDVDKLSLLVSTKKFRRI